jgi:hypothetical protein
VTSGDFVPGKTLVVPHVHKLANLTEVAAGMRAIAVEVVLVDVLEALGREGSQVRLTHDLLADVVNAVAWRKQSQFSNVTHEATCKLTVVDVAVKFPLVVVVRIETLPDMVLQFCEFQI